MTQIGNRWWDGTSEGFEANVRLLCILILFAFGIIMFIWYLPCVYQHFFRKSFHQKLSYDQIINRSCFWTGTCMISENNYFMVFNNCSNLNLVPILGGDNEQAIPRTFLRPYYWNVIKLRKIAWITFHFYLIKYY